MPIFEHDGTKYNVQDRYLVDFSKEYPEATTISERDGNKYRVKAADYINFLVESGAHIPVKSPLHPMNIGHLEEDELQKNRREFEKELQSLDSGQGPKDNFTPLTADDIKIGRNVAMPGDVAKPKNLSQTVQSEIDKRWGGNLQSIIDKARSVNPENVNLAEDMESYFWKVMKDKVPSDSFITQEDLDGFKFTRDYSNGDKDIEYSFGHYTYPQEVVNEFVARHNDEVLHNMRFKEEPEYRNEWFLRNVGVTEQAYRDEVTADLENRLQELRKKVVATLPAQHTRGGYAAIGAAANKPSSGAPVSLGKIDKALKTVNTLRKNSFGAGLKEGFDLADILTLGVNGIGENVALLNALNKSASGKTLTTSEQALVEVWDIQNEAEEVMQVLGGRSLASNIGRGVAQSLGFITQTVGTGGLASAATKGITRAAAKSALKRVASTGVASKIQEGVRYGSLKAAESLVGAAARTPFMGFTYRNYTDKRLNQFQINERVDEATGEISKYIDKQESSALRDAAHAVLESYFESQSEDVGGLIDFGITSFARALPIKQFIRSSAVNGMTGAVKNGSMKWIKESAKIYGLAGEVLSEAYGDAAVNLLTSNTDGWKQMASSEYWWELLGVSSMLSGGFGVVNRAVNSYSGRNLDRQIAHEDNNRRNALSRIEDDMLKKELTEVSLTDDLIERSKMLSSLDWLNFTKEDMANTIDFISAQTRLDVMREGATESRRLARIMPAIDEVKNLADSGALDDEQAAANLATIYSNLFRTQENQRALNILTDRIRVAADAGISADKINDILRNAGLTVFNPGDEVETLTGERVFVDKVLPGAYEVVNNEGDRAVVSFEEVLQNAPEVRQIQQESNQTDGQTESAPENNPQVEQAVADARTQVAEIINKDDNAVYEVETDDGITGYIIGGKGIVVDNDGRINQSAEDTVVVKTDEGNRVVHKERVKVKNRQTLQEIEDIARGAAEGALAAVQPQQPVGGKTYQGIYDNEPVTITLPREIKFNEDGTVDYDNLMNPETVSVIRPNGAVVDEVGLNEIEQLTEAQPEAEQVSADVPAVEQQELVATPAASRRLSVEEIDRVVASMEENATVAPEVELTPENWVAEFGEDGIVSTPIGDVKMGENQYLKLLQRKRSKYFGMIRPTLESPDIVLEEYDPADGAERDTKMLFVKTFVKSDGSRYIHFESVTVRKEDKEVSISSHEVNAEDLKKKMHNDNVVHLNDLFSDSEMRLTRPQSEGPDLVPTPNSSDNKGTTFEPKNQEVAQKNVTEATPVVQQPQIPLLKNGEPDYNAMDAEMFTEQYVARFGEDMTERVARNNIKAANKTISTIEKQIENVTDPNKMPALYAKLQAAQSTKDKYAAVLEELGLSADESEDNAARVQRKKQENTSWFNKLFPEGFPNVESVILWDIANGNRIRWTNKVVDGAVVSKGLGSELGLADSNAERTRRVALIGKDAPTPEEYAEQLPERLKAMGVRFEEGELRDKVLDVYASVDTVRKAKEELEKMAANIQAEQEGLDYEEEQMRRNYEREQEALRQDAQTEVEAAQTEQGQPTNEETQEEELSIEDEVPFMIGRKTFGGNSGYVGYSMSKRAKEAREEGRFPKTDFKRAYNIPEGVLQALVNARIVSNNEWHHTSSFGNKTTFFAWENPGAADYYKIHKEEIDHAVKNGESIEGFVSGFVEAAEEWERQEAEDFVQEQQRKQIERDQNQQKRNALNSYLSSVIPDVYVASNGVEVKTNGDYNTIAPSWIAEFNGERLTKRNGKAKRNEAFDELRAEINRRIDEFMVSSDSVQTTNEAQKLATEAAITALEDAGVEVVNATPEMVEEALQRRDVQMQAVNQRFNEQLDSFTEENANAVIFDLGMPSPMLMAGGVPNKPIRLYGSKLLKKIRKHGFSATELSGLPMALANPIAVFNNYQREGNRSVLIELSTADGNFLVSIDIGVGSDIDFDIVKSVFGKDGDGILNWINKGYLTTVDKEKALAYLRISAPIAEASNKQELDSATKIVGNFENPKIVPGNSFSIAPAPVFVSNAKIAVLGIKQEKATPEQWLKMIEKAGGLKAGEDKWIDLSDWLKASDKKTLTKREVLDYINENQIQIEEVEYDSSWNKPHPIRLLHTTDGLDNKREIALTVPTIEPWNENDVIHFGDAGEGRAIAWVRFGETTDSDGKRVLVIDEIQSKRHQEGRERGYGFVGDVAKAREDADEAYRKVVSFENDMTSKYGDQYWTGDATNEEVAHWELLRSELDRLGLIYENLAEKQRKSIPEAPFEKNWAELAMKRMLRYAAENGYDKVAWTKGDQQAERYDIGSVVNRIESVDTVDYDSVLGVDLIKQVTLFPRDHSSAITLHLTPEGIVRASSMYNGEHIANIVGEEIGGRIMSDNNLILKGQDLRIGGEGMRAFYDQMLPSFMRKYGKKWGATVQDVTLPNVEEAGRTMHSVNVTDSMRESVMQGQPMFYRRPNGTVYGWTNGTTVYLTDSGMNPNTPIHEYTHIWADAMRKHNPEGWKSIVKLLKGTPVWNEVMADANYANIHGNENQVASEALSRISGRENAAKMEAMAQQMIDENANDTVKKHRARKLLDRMRKALQEFWSWVGKELFGIKNFESIEQVTDRILYDLVSGTGLNPVSSFDTSAAERENIIAKAQADGTYLKAPNGKDTNLTPEQWVTVRTKAFKRWFGDWESNAEVDAMQRRVLSWLSEKNLEWARGKSRDEIMEHFGNIPEPIAYIPVEYLGYLGQEVTNNRVYSGMGYFIDHVVNHHPGIGVEKYVRIQEVLSNPDEVKAIKDKGNDSIVFIKEIDRFNAVVIEIEQNKDGQIVWHKSFYDQRKKPYANKGVQLFSRSLEGGGSSIIRTEDSAHDSSLSVLNDTTNIRRNFVIPSESSKIVDANSEPLVVWHGGEFATDEFVANGSMHFGTKVAALQRILDNAWGYGSWSVARNADGRWNWEYTNPDDAGYDKQGETAFASPIDALVDAARIAAPKAVLRPYYVNIRNLERTEDQNSDWVDAVSFSMDAGYDGIIYRNDFEDEGEDSYVAFYPNQIKLADGSNMTFAPDNNDIRFSVDAELRKRTEKIASEAQKIADKFGLSNEIVVAETQDDYIREIKSEGIRDEDIDLDTYAVYMPSGRIVVNAEAVDNMAELSDSIMHEFAHNVTRGGDMLYGLQDTVLEVGEDLFEAAGREIFGQTTDPLVVADEIIANFVGCAANPSLFDGLNLAGEYVDGRLPFDQIYDLIIGVVTEELRVNCTDVLNAVKPYVKEVLDTIKTNHNGPKETRRVRVASRENRETQVLTINGLQPNAGDENAQTGDTSKTAQAETGRVRTRVQRYAGGQKKSDNRSNDESYIRHEGYQVNRATSENQAVERGRLEGVNEFSIGNGEEIDRRTHSEGEFVLSATSLENAGANLQPDAGVDGEGGLQFRGGLLQSREGVTADAGGQMGGGTRAARADLAESNQTAKSDSRARLIAELRQKLRDVKAETRTVAAEVGKIVRKAITAELIDKMGKRTFDNIVRTIETATVRRDVEYAVNRIEEAVLDMELRDKQDKFDKYLNLRVQGESARGVSIAANVTDQVRQFITIIRDNLNRPASEVEALIEERGGSLAERTGLQVLGFYQDARNFEREVQEIEDEIEKIKSENTELRKKRAALNKAGKTNDAKNLSDQINANKETIEHLNSERISTKRSQLYYIDMAANELEREIAYGKEGHKEWLQQEAERKRELLKIAWNDIGDGKDIPIFDEQEPIWKKTKNAVVDFLLAPAYSWDYLLKMISVNAPNGEGALYDHFMRSENGYVAASGNYYQAYEDFKARLNEKAKDIFGKDYKKVLKDSNQPLDVTIWISFQHPTTDEDKIRAGASEIYTPTIGEVVYAYMAAKMPDGRVKLDNMGVKEDIIDSLVRQIPQGYITFADWVQNEFLPERRKVYNKTHLEVFGTQMAQIENYVPLKVKKDFVYEEFDGSKIDKAELPSSITGSIIKRKRNSLPIDLHTNIFDLLLDHGQQMEHWNAYTRIVRDTNQFLSNTKIRRALDYRKKGLHRKLKEAALIASNSYQSDVDRLEKMTVALSKMAASSKIAFRINTAIKQVLSYPAFYAYVADARFWGYLTRNLGPDTWGRNFRWALDNIPSFQERWLGRMVGDDRLAQMTSPQLDRWIKGMGSLGMFSNALVDAVTCANGAQAVYRYEHERYLKIGLDESEADRLAKIAAAQAMNQTQQSSEGMYLSRIQADRTAFAVAISTFQNSNFAYLRKELEGIDQLMRDTKKQIANREKYYEQQGVNPDRAAKLALQDVASANRTAVAKILVFGFILNTIWTLGNSVWKYAFGDEDEEDKWEDAAIRGFFNSFTRNLSVGQYVETVAWSDFRELNPSLLLSDLNKFIKRLESTAEGNVKMWDRTAAWTVLSTLSSLGLGVDINSFASMCEGVQGAIDNGANVEDIMLLVNAPRSHAKFIAGPPKEGETLDEYIKRQAWIERKIVSRIDKKQLDKWSRNYEAYKQAKMLGVPYSQDKMGRVSVPYIKDIDDSYSALLKSVGRTKSGAKRNDGDSIADDVKTRIRDFGLIKRIKDINAMEKNLDAMVILDGAYPERLKELCEAKQQLIEEWNQ